MTALNELSWEAGGLLLTDPANHMDVDGERGVEGLDDTGEIDGDDHDGAGDGQEMSRQRLTSRPITIGVVWRIDDETDGTVFAGVLKALRQITSPLPDRSNAVRLLRWRNKGASEPTRRIHYRPARGKPLEIVQKGSDAYQRYGGASFLLHLEAPMPVLQSDTLHTHTYSGAGSAVIANAGSFTATGTGLWELTAAGPVTISHDDYPGESVTFPGTSTTVTRPPGSAHPEIIATAGGLTTYGICHGPANTLFPRWPLLRPGDNNISASAACTLTWRDTD